MSVIHANIRGGLAAFLLLLVLSAQEAAGQFPVLPNAVPSEERKLIVNYATFPSTDPSRVRLEVYYQVYNYGLEFERVSDQLFRARYVTTVRLIDRDADTVVSSSRQEREATVDQLLKTKSTGDFRTAQVNFEVPPGKYEVGFLLETIGSRSVLKRDFNIDIKGFGNKNPQLSDVELVQAAGPMPDGEVPEDFAKGDLMIIPSLTGTFSSEDQGKIMFYLEISRGSDSASEVTIETSLRRGSRGMVYRDSLTAPLNERITRQLREISLEDYMPGEYELSVSLHGRRYKKLDEKKVSFRVPWTSTAILRHDWDAALDQLELITDRNDVKPMRKIEDLGERVKAIERFWAERDPDPSTSINEMKVVFYHRIDAANRLFSVLNREGWRTDRGRVLIRYGEPDQIDDFPLVPDRYPYQEWHYYRDGRYRKFVFVDVNEDGE